MTKTFDKQFLIKQLSQLRLAPNSSGADESIKLLCSLLQFNVHQFSAGLECNGWIVPHKWEVKQATIKDSKGRLVYDGKLHPLGVIGYSQSFRGTILGSTLRNHLYYSEVFEDALVYHCDLFYKPHRKEWGFSVPKTLFKKIRNNNKYKVNLVTSFEPGTMKVAEYVLPGLSKSSIILNAHNCHAFCCNDDLSGVAVGIDIINELANLPKRYYTYRLIIGPEHFGSIFYLNNITKRNANSLKAGVFLESLGSKGPLALQRSFLGKTSLDSAFMLALQEHTKAWRTEPFRKIVGNDETVWEATGFQIPFPSLSRVPFKEYHTSKDCPELMSLKHLDEAKKVVLSALRIIEDDCVMSPKFRGLVALSNPRYDLYQPFWDPSERGRQNISDQAVRWNYLMDCLPRYFDGETPVSAIAKRHELPFQKVKDYVAQFERRGLIGMHRAPLAMFPQGDLPPF